MRKLILTSFMVLLLVPASYSQSSAKDKGMAAITMDALKAQTGFLASEWTEGRETGAKGEYLSADYIASMLQLYGIQPGGDYFTVRDQATGKLINKRSYFQNFSLITSKPGDEQRLTTTILEDGATKTIEFENGTDFLMDASYPGGTVVAPIVFAGYGYVDANSAYNDFQGIDIKGKVILRLRGIPESASANLSPYSAYRASAQKDAYAIENGAVGILEVDPANIDGSGWTPQPDFLISSPSERGLRRQRVRYSISDDKMNKLAPKASISLKVANTILKGSGIDIKKFAEGNTNSLKPQKGFNNTVLIKTSVKSTFVKVRNVIGVIEGKNSDNAIVIGAHYDHLGMRDGYIYNGADDNASGTVGVLTIAKAIKATGEDPDKTIVFALWTGEEKGLLGSKYYTNNPTIPLESIRLNINFDMISRYISDDQPNSVTMMYSPACPEFKDITINHLKNYNIELEPKYLNTDNPPGGTDHLSFMAKDIPYMRFKPGHREEYHTPADEVSTLDWDIMEKIVKINFLNAWELANNKW